MRKDDFMRKNNWVQAEKYMDYIAADVCSFKKHKSAGHYNAAAADLQQIVEKVMKAYGVYKGGLSNSLKRSHDLRKLGRDGNVASVCEDLSGRDLNKMSAAYFKGRYPEKKKYSLEEVEDLEAKTMKIIERFEQEVGLFGKLKEEVEEWKYNNDSEMFNRREWKGFSVKQFRKSYEKTDEELSDEVDFLRESEGWKDDSEIFKRRERKRFSCKQLRKSYENPEEESYDPIDDLVKEVRRQGGLEKYCQNIQLEKLHNNYIYNAECDWGVWG